MKKIIVSFAMMFFATLAMAQTKPMDWAELKTFHDVMSETFHPAEEGKLDPIKTRSEEMVKKAITWQKSAPPADFDKPEIKKTLGKLVKGTKELNKMVKKDAADADLTKKLNGLHDVFHDIIGLCKDGH